MVCRRFISVKMQISVRLRIVRLAKMVTHFNDAHCPINYQSLFPMLLRFYFLLLLLSSPAASFAQADDEIYLVVEQQPQFANGMEDFYAFVQENIQYPAGYFSKATERVFLNVVIEKDGSLSNIEVVRSPDLAPSREALRIMALSSPWQPGMHQGAPRRVQLTLPIVFQPEEKPKKATKQRRPAK